jgi:hypothetical protein
MTVVNLQPNGGTQRTRRICSHRHPPDSRVVYFTPPLKVGRSKGDLGMSRIMVAVVVVGVIATTVIWSNVIQVKSQVAATFTKTQAAEEGRQIISPLDIMIMQGKTAPVEGWGDAF